MGKAAAAPKEKKEKAPKDPNAPKRALAAYMIFCKDFREVVKEENPGITFGEIGKKLGAKWAEVDEKTKKKYADLHEADKKRYEEELAAYKK